MLLDSEDFLEDAVEIMHKGPFQFIMFTGNHDNSTRIDSDLDKNAREMLLQWVRSGDMERILLEHFERNPL